MDGVNLKWFRSYSEPKSGKHLPGHDHEYRVTNTHCSSKRMYIRVINIPTEGKIIKNTKYNHTRIDISPERISVEATVGPEIKCVRCRREWSNFWWHAFSLPLHVQTSTLIRGDSWGDSNREPWKILDRLKPLLRSCYQVSSQGAKIRLPVVITCPAGHAHGVYELHGVHTTYSTLVFTVHRVSSGERSCLRSLSKNRAAQACPLIRSWNYDKFVKSF
jgi:hypothetical protein